MGKFLSGVGSFVFIFILIIICSYCFNIILFSKSSLLKIVPEKHILVLGDSHTKYAINDKQIPSVINFSDDADSYYYSYLKLKAIKNKNPQVDTLLLAFSTHNIERDTEVKWLLNSTSVKSRFRFYHTMMNASDFYALVKLKGKDVMINLPSILTFPLHWLRRGDKLYGGYEDLEMDDLKGALKRDSLKLAHSDEAKFEYSELETLYLEKIRIFCRNEGIQLILISTPLYEQDRNRISFHKFYQSHYSETLFIDLSRFELTSDCFGDIVHLNKKGALIFSDYIKQQGLGRLLKR